MAVQSNALGLEICDVGATAAWPKACGLPSSPGLYSLGNLHGAHSPKWLWTRAAWCPLVSWYNSGGRGQKH